MENHTGMPSVNWKHRSGFLAVSLLAILLIYFPVFKNGFVLDDIWWLDNAAAWQNHPVQSIFLEGDVAFFEPVTNVFWFTCFRFFGLNCIPYYVLTIMLQMFAVILVAKMVLVLCGVWKPACISGLLFVMYPGHQEAGYYLSAVDTLFQTISYVLTALMYLGFLRSGKYRFYAGTIACMVLAFISKQSTATLIAVLIMADLLIKPFNRHTLVRLIPFACLTLCYAALIIFNIGTLSEVGKTVPDAPVGNIEVVPKSMSFKMSVNGLATYARTVAGLFLAFFHRGTFFSPFNFPLTPAFLLIMIPVLGISFAAAIYYQKEYRKQLWFGLSWVFITILPFVFWEHKVLASSRYTHLPAAGMCLFWGITLYNLAHALSKRGGILLSNSVLSGLLMTALCNGILESRAMNNLDRYRESRQTKQVIRILHESYDKSKQPVYLYRFDKLKPWQRGPVSRLYFNGNLHTMETLPEHAKSVNGSIASTRDGTIIWLQEGNP